jgi:hypothetical protein
VASPAYWAGWKTAATSLSAIVAGWLRSSSRYTWQYSWQYFRRYSWTAAKYLRQSTAYAWPIAADHFRKASRHLCATAATGLRQSTEYLWPVVAFYLGKASGYFKATVATWVHQSDEYLGPTVTGYLGKSSKTAAVAALAIASSLVGFVTTSAVLRPPAPASAPAAREARPQAKLSWVTDFELERAQKLGRKLLDISPAQLLAMYERNGSDAVETYRDGWVKIDYPIVSFDRQTFDKTTYDVVEAAAHFQSVFPGKIIAIFNAQKWGAQLHMHRAGDQIVAFCKFREIEREEVLTNIHRLWFYGTGCDLPQLLESTNAMNIR